MTDRLSRRGFVETTLLPSLTGMTVGQSQQEKVPWYRRAYRWGQTNITEIDPTRYDIPWWREFWKRTQVQGVIINAGGIVAYYPSKYPLHHRAQFLGDRDLFGDLSKAAHEDGLAVLARMDSNRTAEDFYKAHPDWFAIDAAGSPYRAADLYVTCVNSAYYDEFLPGVLREIVERYQPEGFTDNSWSGLGRESICYCQNCERKFRGKAGHAIPRKADWGDTAYRHWIEWNYARRLEIWDLNNRVTQAAGGPDCIWVGMNSGSVTNQSRSFRDLKGIAKRAQIILLDHQARNDSTGFQQNGETGKLMHGLLGWDKLMPESMAMYQAGRTPFRVSAKPAAEARMWMLEGFAGGIQPWWHHISAYHEDRRMYRTAEPVMRWHKANERYLMNRSPIATVGVVWSQRNTDFHGRDRADELVELPYRGFTQALIRARIPYQPVHVDDIDRARELSVLILPNVAAMSDEQCAAVRRFVSRGGSLIATGASSLENEWGDPRPDFALADLFKTHAGKTLASDSRRWAGQSAHTYLRLTPELRARVYGPKAGNEPLPAGERHQILRGFDETDILPYGGMLAELQVDAGAAVPMTFIPAFPVYPPETAWMRQPKTSIAGAILNARPNGARIAYLPADIDRRYARDYLPDHGNLLANIVLWAAHGDIPLRVEGPGLIDCHLYQQPGRVILHLVNLTSAGTWRAPMDELISVGPFQVSVRIPDTIQGRALKLLVSQGTARMDGNQSWATFEVKSILDHEVAVIE